MYAHVGDDTRRRFRIMHTEAATGWGGQQIRIVDECVRMIARGHSVVMVCQPGAVIEAKAREAGIPLYTIRMRGATDVGGIAVLYGVMRRFRPDIVDTHSSKDTWTALIAARLAGGIRTVRTRHMMSAAGAGWSSRFMYHKLCDYVVTTGEKVRKRLIESVGLSPDRVLSIPTGIDLDRFDPGRADRWAFRREIGVPDGVPLVGCVGMLYREKGHQYLIEAAARIAAERDDVRFVIVGDIPSGRDTAYREELHGLVERHGLTDRLIFAGYRSDIPEVMASFDVLALSSTNEGLPQVVVQALAMNLPVVAADVGSVSQIVIDGQTGLLVPMADVQRLAQSISAMLSDSDKAREMASNGRRLIEDDYGINAMIRKTESVYYHLLCAAESPSLAQHGTAR